MMFSSNLFEINTDAMNVYLIFAVSTSTDCVTFKGGSIIFAMCTVHYRRHNIASGVFYSITEKILARCWSKVTFDESTIDHENDVNCNASYVKFQKKNWIFSDFFEARVRRDEKKAAGAFRTKFPIRFFHDPIIHLVYPPKFLHKHCFEFLLGRLYVIVNPKRN